MIVGNPPQNRKEAKRISRMMGGEFLKDSCVTSPNQQARGPGRSFLRKVEVIVHRMHLGVLKYDWL